MSSERLNIAQELHDGIAQELVGLGFSIDAVIAGNLESESKEELRRIRFAISELIAKVRIEIHALRKSEQPGSDLAKGSIDYEIGRVFTELLRNIREHSMATRLNIKISDNGIGGAISKEGHFGLIGVQERIANLNGDIAIESNQDGTTISIEIPLDG